jgi:hypothetical protein
VLRANSSQEIVVEKELIEFSPVISSRPIVKMVIYFIDSFLMDCI